MKNPFIACALALGIALSASAENYNAVYAGYAGLLPTEDVTIYQKEVKTINGFEVGYLYGIGLGQSKSAIEVGLALGYNSWANRYILDNYSEKTTLHQFNVRIPVNFTYKFSCSQYFAVAPYIGVNLRINPMNKAKVETMDYVSENDMCTYGHYYVKEGFKRIQTGGQIGLKLYWQKFFVYGQYGYDFMNVYKGTNLDVKTMNFSAGVGYSF